MRSDALENLARIGQLKNRNLAEYEGYIETSEAVVEELCELIPVLLTATRHLSSTK